MKLNLGAGQFKLNEFINIDIDESTNPDLVCDIRKLPYKDDSIDYIYAGHILEHFTLEDVRKVLIECFRVLKKGSEMGIVVPEKDLTPKNMIGGEDRKYMKHYSYWDIKMLKKEVKKIGFEIEEMNIDSYPYLVARPKWQIGIIAFKEGKMKKEKSEKVVEIPEFNEKEYSWCKNEEKVVYNPKKKKHCPYCFKLI